MKRNKSDKKSLPYVFIATVIFLFGFLFRGVFFNNRSETVKTETNQIIQITPVTERYQVKRVIDGDTLVLVGNKRLRLIAVNAPEIGQKWSLEAKKYVEELTLGKIINVEFENRRIDDYGRMLGYVWIHDNLLEEKLLEEGFARLYYYNGDENIKYLTRLQAAEKWGKDHHNGIWLDTWIKQ